MHIYLCVIYIIVAIASYSIYTTYMTLPHLRSKGSAVLFDVAHNIIQLVNSMHSYGMQYQVIGTLETVV